MTEVTIYGKISISCHPYCVCIRVCLTTKVFSLIFVLGGSNENGSTPSTSDSDGTFISYRLVIFYICFLILRRLIIISIFYLMRKNRFDTLGGLWNLN